MAEINEERQNEERQTENVSKHAAGLSYDDIGADTYISEADRFVVSLVVGFAEDDGHVDEGGPIDSAAKAAHWALMMTRGAGSEDTIWWVHDRKTGRGHRLAQAEFEDGEALFG